MEQGAIARSAAVAAFTTVLLAQGLTAAADSDVARVIVKFRAGSALASASGHSQAASTGARAAALGARLGLPMSGGPAVSDRTQVMFASGVTSAALAQRLAQESDVEYAVPDERRRIVRSPNDPLYAEGVPGNGPAAGQWYLRAPSGDVRSSLDIERGLGADQRQPAGRGRGRGHRRALRAPGPPRGGRRGQPAAGIRHGQRCRRGQRRRRP